MKTYTQEELNEILRLHKLWLDNKEGGQKANLSYADLSYANLSYANLHKTLLNYSENKTYSPINITSLKYFVTIFKDEIYWGCRTFKNVDEIKSFTIDMCSEEWDEEQFNIDKEIIINTDTLYQKYWAK